MADEVFDGLAMAVGVQSARGTVNGTIAALTGSGDETAGYILGDRESGYVFPSPRGGHYSARRLQQLVKEIAAEAGIAKNVYPHLLRHTMAQYLADQGMPENLLQKFLGHEHPASTQVYYEPARTQVKRAFQDAMGS